MFGANKEVTALKRNPFDPPDVYPQMHDQIEDKLNGDVLKLGFINKPRPNEYLTKKIISISRQQIISFISDIYDKKHETKPPNIITKKKQPQIANTFKLQFFPFTPQSKSAVDAWMKSLAQGKPFDELLRQVPYFNRKEEIFMSLFTNKVPVDRCAWYIKVSSLLYLQHAENNRKKINAKNHSPASEWTTSIMEFIDGIKEVLLNGKRENPTHFSKGQPRNLSNNFYMPEFHESRKMLDFLVTLVEYTYEERMLSRFSLFKWLVSMTEKFTSNMEFMCWQWNLCSKFINQISRYVFLTRRLAMSAAYSLSNLLFLFKELSESQNESPGSLTCSNARYLVKSLTKLICLLVIRCPTAFVQYSLNVSNIIVKFSPVDFLPKLPSYLISENNDYSPEMISKLKESESLIIKRSVMCEYRWKCYSQSSCEAGQKLEWIFTCLEKLNDSQFLLAPNGINEIYKFLYKEVDYPNLDSWNEKEFLNFLFQWAVFEDDGDFHRPIVVAEIISRRLSHLVDISKDQANQQTKKSDFIDEFRNVLCDFLSNCQIPDAGLYDRWLPFTRICHLVSELTYHGLFSNSSYIKYLITNGILSIPYQAINLVDEKSTSVKKEGNPDYSRSRSTFDTKKSNLSNSDSQRERHLLYLKHFPLETRIEPTYSENVECYLKNERLTFIYGYCEERDILSRKFKEIVFKVLKGVTPKVFSHIKDITYFSHDGEFRKLSVSLAKYRTRLKFMPIGDRAYITGLCASKALNFFGSLISNEHQNELIPIFVIEWILEMLDLSFSVSSLLKFCVNLVKILAILYEKFGNLIHCYVLGVFFSVIGILDKHRMCFFLNINMVYDVFSSIISCINDKVISVSCFSHLVIIKDFINMIFRSFPSFKNKVNMDYQSFCYDCTRIITNGFVDGFYYYLALDDSPSARITSESLWSYQTSVLIQPNPGENFIQNLIANIVRVVVFENDMSRVYKISLHCAEICTLNRSLQEEFIGAIRALFDRTSNSVYPMFYAKMNMLVEKFNIEALIIFIATFVSRRCISVDSLFSLFLSLIPSVPLNLKRFKRGYDINSFRILMHIFSFIFHCQSKKSEWTPPDSTYYSLDCLYDRIFTNWAYITVPGMIMFEFYQHLYGFFSRFSSIINIDSSLISSDTSPKLNLFSANKVVIDEIWSWLNLITNQHWVKKMCFFDSAARDRVLSSQRQESMTNEQYIEMIRHMCFPDLPYFQSIDFSDNSFFNYINDIFDSTVVWNVRQKIVLLEHIIGPKEINSRIVDVIINRIFKSSDAPKNDSHDSCLVYRFLNSPDNANWLIIRIINNMQQLHTRVIEEAVKLLDDENFCIHPDFFESAKSEQIGIFVNLIVSCLRVNPSLRDIVLKCLLSQFARITENSKTICKSNKEKYYNQVLCPLYIRMKLLTKLFDYVIAEQSVNWMVVLSQLILREIVNMKTDSELFLIVYDMITSLTIVIDGDDTSAIIEFRKKIRPDINEASESCKNYIWGLLPPEDEIYDQIISCNSFGHRLDVKSKKVSSGKFDPMSGLQVSDRLILNPWEIIEGYKGSVLNPSHFSMHTVEGYEPKYIRNNRLLCFHTHMNHFPYGYYFQEIETSQMEVLPKEQVNRNCHSNPISDSESTIIQIPPPQCRRPFNQVSQDSVESPVANKILYPRFPNPSLNENDFIHERQFRKSRMNLDNVNFRPDQFNPNTPGVYRQSTPHPHNIDHGGVNRRPLLMRPPILSTYSNSPHRQHMENFHKMSFNPHQRPYQQTSNSYYMGSNIQQNQFKPNVSCFDSYNMDPSFSMVPIENYHPPSVFSHENYFPHRGFYPETRFTRNDVYRHHSIHPTAQGYRHPRPNTPDGFQLNMQNKNKYPRNL